MSASLQPTPVLTDEILIRWGYVWAGFMFVLAVALLAVGLWLLVLVTRQRRKRVPG